MTKNADKKVAPVVVSDTVSADSETAQPTSEQAAAQTEVAAGHDVATTAPSDTSSPQNVEADVHLDESHQDEGAPDGGEMPPPVDTVRMIRDEPMHDGGPVEADVHPDEVQNWFAVGWRVE